MTEGLGDRLALVTGGASGIGLATARHLAVAGARVVLSDISARRGEAAAADLRRLGLDVVFRHHDAGDPQSWSALGGHLKAEGRPLRVLVNNAYSGRAGTALSLTPEQLRECMRVNVEGALLGIQMAAELMSEGGAIVNLSSIAALRPAPQNLGYAIAKMAVIQLTQAAAITFAQAGVPIRVNAVAPGAVDTHALRSTLRVLRPEGDGDTEALAAMAAATPMGRIAQPTEIAEIIGLLASDASGALSGHCVIADGGALLVP